ncbi:S-adenosylmethionine tRNA ribosyltransferase [Mycobacterium asiaticum]|uniref:S-adenosylmethionine tRNA ribosyltransferase n=1 Tax=Mycobacterium asiaticum TaxID=1790 RepID=A0A1A3CRV9_MYCAS|nr:S-adenosylmethionine tRNA ribosyltransferase [Mycobacterium asiaticum]
MTQRLRSSILALARNRGPDSSICPSDAARAIGGQTWRDLMPDARELARELAAAGHVVITQRGETLDPDAQWTGPIRITTRHSPDADVR